ncbi:MAG: histidine phosphatase family protein [Chloroflexi bacterium]|nr:histidine phosphatase family protein [Chloroflexota bacterium]
MSSNILYLVRHGENPANLTREFSHRHVDYSLTERGIRQAEQTAAYFAALSRENGGTGGVDAIFSSPLKRALQTAEIVGAATGHGVTVIEEFREINVGDLEGQPPTDAIWDYHDRILERWRDGEHTVCFPGGEDYLILLARVRRGLAQATAGRSGQRIVIVAHGGIVGATLADVCHDVDHAAIMAIPNANCAVTEIEAQVTGSGLTGTLKRWASRDHLTG